MKKLLFVMFVLATLILVSGCQITQQPTATQQQTTPQPATEETTQPDGTSSVQQQPLYAISLTPQAKETKDENGNLKFIYSYQTLSLVLPEPEIADKIILDYLNRMDQADQYADSMRADSLQQENGNDIPFMYDIAYSPLRFDSAVLSMQETAMLQTGGSHPNTYSHFYTYDLLSGSILKLSDIVFGDITVDKLENLVAGALANTEGLIQGYEDTIHDMFKIGLEEYKYWYFSESGLCFHFDPYVLAPYAVGPVTAVLPYSQLTGILKDEYFLQERDSYNGDLIVEEFFATAQYSYTEFAEAVLTEDGTNILLSTEGLITDIRIEVTEIKRGVTTTVMAAQSLTPGTALMVQFDANTTTLSVSYNSGNQITNKLIAYSDGSLKIS